MKSHLPEETTDVQTTTLYDSDFYAWTQQQVDLLRAGQWAQVDIENLIEEIESLGKQQQQELRNRLEVLLGHLLKWYFQPEARSKSWRATINEQRFKIQRLLKENPSLKPYLTEAIEIGYAGSIFLVDKETPLTPQQLPPSCPFSQAEIFEQTIELEE
jgi:hypothetical protein